ncbi:MAG TPA: serine/threonine-protein kinase [Polyangiaceae bacterium]|jgi:serine/threonine-protein kinase
MTEPNNKVPRPPPRSAPSSGDFSASEPTSGQVAAATIPQRPSDSTGLKVVTISPGSISYSDADVTSSQVARIRQDPYLGSTIDGRYKVEALLGEGGMGVVYRCTHTIIGKKVAMKVLRADLARDAEVTERFLNEAKAASAIGNAHIIDISDFGQFPDGSTYFVMEFLTGQPLSKLLEGGQPIPVPRIVHIARQLAEGLSAAHAANIVHRDLKPDNIFLIARGAEKDFIKILDFGIAKVSSSSEGAKLTRAGAVFGTPHYMSPEQAAGQPVDHRGDIYSFGVILYELASGRVPFDADNFMGILTQHMYKAPVPIRALVPTPQDVPPGLEAIVLKCLSKRAEHRYQSMDEMLAEFDKLSAGLVPDAVPEMMARSGGFNVPADYFKKGHMPEPVPASPESRPAMSRFPLYAGIAGIAAAIAIVVGIFAHGGSSAATQPTAEVASAPAKAAESAPAAAATKADDVTISKQVMLAAEPIEAHVFRDGTDLGQSPLAIDVEEGKAVKLSVVLDGYKEQDIQLDGSTTREVVRLEKLARPGAARPAAPARRAPEPEKAKPAPKKGKSLGGSEIVNPWGN